jgi:nucleoside-diphosphate-sugar epimerase
VFIERSILDRPKLTEIFRGCDCIVHISALHGIHEDRGEKNAYDFFDLNVRGTFEVFEAAVSLGIDKAVFISTTGVYRPDTRYGSSKILAELIAEDYRKHRDMNVITLRPRGFFHIGTRRCTPTIATGRDGSGRERSVPNRVPWMRPEDHAHMVEGLRKGRLAGGVTGALTLST